MKQQHPPQQPQAPPAPPPPEARKAKPKSSRPPRRSAKNTTGGADESGGAAMMMMMSDDDEQQGEASSAPAATRPRPPPPQGQQPPNQKAAPAAATKSVVVADASLSEESNDALYKAIMNYKRMEQQRTSSLISDTKTITEAILRKQAEAKNARNVISACTQYATNAKYMQVNSGQHPRIRVFPSMHALSPDEVDVYTSLVEPCASAVVTVMHNHCMSEQVCLCLSVFFFQTPQGPPSLGIFSIFSRKNIFFPRKIGILYRYPAKGGYRKKCSESESV